VRVWNCGLGLEAEVRVCGGCDCGYKLAVVGVGLLFAERVGGVVGVHAKVVQGLKLLIE
jgi:hypothetical protein